MNESPKSRLFDVAEKYREGLRRYILRRVPNSSDADDVVQETFRKLVETPPEWRGEKPFVQWLYRVTQNAIADFYRSRAREDIPVGTMDIEGSPQPVMLEELFECIDAILADLPEKYRETLRLREVEGLKVSAIAEKLNLSIPGTKSRLQRGRKIVADRLGACCEVHTDSRGIVTGFEHHGDRCIHKAGGYSG